MALDPSKALTKNRVDIIKNVANPNEVADYLYSYGIFTEDMKASVEQEPEKEKKTRCILDTLKYRGKKAPRALFDALIDSDNKEVAEKLAPYLKASADEDNKYSPSKWPPEDGEQSRMEKDEVIRINDLKHPDFYFEYLNSGSKIYKMKNKVRGKTLIINNVKFKKFSERAGSDVDAKNISLLFKELHFEVTQRDNLKKQEMVQFLMEERDKIKDNDGIECLVLIIMSHGHTVGVYGVDEEELELKTMTDLFTSEQCPSLNEKPRLIFVQACRGENAEVESRGVQVSVDGVDGVGLAKKVENMHVGQGKDEIDAVRSAESDFSKTVHSAADFLIAYATPEGTPAYRNIHSGSWFLNAIVWTFKYHAHRMELHHMLLKVNDLVSKGRTLKGHLTVAEYKNALRKKFYFFPGVHGDTATTL